MFLHCVVTDAACRCSTAGIHGHRTGPGDLIFGIANGADAVILNSTDYLSRSPNPLQWVVACSAFSSTGYYGSVNGYTISKQGGSFVSFSSPGSRIAINRAAVVTQEYSKSWGLAELMGWNLQLSNSAVDAVSAYLMCVPALRPSQPVLAF